MLRRTLASAACFVAQLYLLRLTYTKFHIPLQVNLNVLEREQVIAPKFVERFQTVHVRPGEPVSLSCRAVGAPTPRITWQKDGAPIDSSASLRIVTDGGASMLDIPWWVYR